LFFLNKSKNLSILFIDEINCVGDIQMKNAADEAGISEIKAEIDQFGIRQGRIR
jgi:ATP-dependent 26S proteasome regulatory subunit